MTNLIYQTVKNSVGVEVIVRNNEDGSQTQFFADPTNSDYQAYLESLEPKATKVVDEAAPE